MQESLLVRAHLVMMVIVVMVMMVMVVMDGDDGDDGDGGDGDDSAVTVQHTGRIKHWHTLRVWTQLLAVFCLSEEASICENRRRADPCIDDGAGAGGGARVWEERAQGGPAKQ